MTKTSKEDLKEFKRQAAELGRKKNVDDKVHYADPKKVHLTLCGKPISPAKVSALEKDITCERCKAELGKAAMFYPSDTPRRGQPPR
jgi:hypothetical protein